MSFNRYTLALVFLLLFSVELSSAAGQGCTSGSCVVTQLDYENMMTNFRELYGDLRVTAVWSENRPQAFARRGELVVSGGFARKSDISLGGLLIVTCHEVGHALFSHNEGEADYFATQKCLKAYFNSFKGEMRLLVKQAPQRVVSFCGLQSELSQEVCKAGLVASQNAAQADANRCVERLERLKADVEGVDVESVQVEEFHFRCLRAAPGVVSPVFEKQALLEAATDSLSVLSPVIDHFVEDQRIVRVPYGQHNSPLCRMNTLREGLFDRPEPLCWK